MAIAGRLVPSPRVARNQVSTLLGKLQAPGRPSGWPGVAIVRAREARLG